MTMKPDTNAIIKSVIGECWKIYRQGNFRPKPVKSEALGSTATVQPDSPGQASEQQDVISEPMMVSNNTNTTGNN